MLKLRPHLWYVDRLDAACERYKKIFADNFRQIRRNELEGTPSPGTVITIEFELFGLPVMALQGGPDAKLTDAFSFYLSCDDQAEVDRYWAALLEGGGKETQCGWLVDPFGVSWQVVPKRLDELLETDDKAKKQRVIDAMLKMIKLDVAKLEAAARG